MKNLMFSSLVLFTLTSATLMPPAETTVFTVDAGKSQLKWTGKKVTGSHWGYVKFSSGSVTAEKGTIKGGEFTVDMASIDVQDLKPETGGNKLVGHLKADDFFGVAKFPTATLKLKSVNPTGGSNYDCVADLTIKGITQEVKFPAEISIADGTNLSAKATVTVDRTKWDIKYGSGSIFKDLGNKAINDDFTLEIDLKANAPAPPPAAAETPKKKAPAKPKSATRKQPK